MEKILVPTDFSEYAVQATHTAVQLAAKTGAQIILFNNVDAMINWNAMTHKEHQKYPEILGKTMQAQVKLEKMMKSNLFKNVKVEKVLTHGVTYEEIVMTARKKGVDLIVMGTHGNEGSGKYFIGSSAQKVMREATCPVLSIKKNAEVKQWKSVVFPASFEEDLREPFEHIRKLALELGAVIHLLFVNTPAHFKDTRTALKQINAFASRYKGVKFHAAIFNHFEMEAGIMEFAEGIKADWLAMATHNRRHVPKYNIGITETLVYRSEIPVLSVTIPAKHLK